MPYAPYCFRAKIRARVLRWNKSKDYGLGFRLGIKYMCVRYSRDTPFFQMEHLTLLSLNKTAAFSIKIQVAQGAVL